MSLAHLDTLPELTTATTTTVQVEPASARVTAHVFATPDSSSVLVTSTKELVEVLTTTMTVTLRKWPWTYWRRGANKRHANGDDSRPDYYRFFVPNPNAWNNGWLESSLERLQQNFSFFHHWIRDWTCSLGDDIVGESSSNREMEGWTRDKNGHQIGLFRTLTKVTWRRQQLIVSWPDL